MIIPLCCGMERSGSTLTWQIVKSIIPRSRPLGWEPQCEVVGWEGHPVDWPVKRHHYFAGERPVVYTYRHPVEALLSARRVFGSDAGTSVRTECEDQEDADAMALEKIMAHQEIYERYKKDASHGRQVLFLKYEDFYHDTALRVKEIASFLQIDPPLTEYEVSILCDYTRVDKNIERASKLKSFNDNRDPNSGMQAQHIDVTTRGEPGALMRKHPAFVHAVQEGLYGLGSLKEMCTFMGYEIPKVQKNSSNKEKMT